MHSFAPHTINLSAAPRRYRILLALVLCVLTASDVPAGGARQLQAEREDSSGVLRGLFGLSARVASRDPEAASREFLSSQSKRLGIAADESSLATASVHRVPGGAHVRFRQLCDGIPVYRSEVVVSVNAEGLVTMVSSSHTARPAVETTIPSLSPEEAIARSQAHLRGTGTPVGSPDGAELVVYRDGAGRARLAYRTTLVRAEPEGDWEILVDADSGEILHAENRLVYSSGSHADGFGFVYRSDPLSAARRTYGDPGFADDDDRASDSLNAYRRFVRLDSLVVEDGKFHLRNPFCSITEIEPPADPSTYTSDRADGFVYTRAESGFEAVMGLYHATLAYRRLEELGYSLPRLRTLRIDPHGRNGADNSAYSPSGNWISLGTGFVDDGEDADVIWHEYGHAIQYAINPSWGGGECASLGEGFADYWAGGYSRDLDEWPATDPAYQWLFQWDGHNPFWSGRLLDDPGRYPFVSSSPHQNGQVWASTLMSIRDDLGRETADRLVLKSLHYLAPGVTAVDAAHALLQADRDLFGGSHLERLVHWLGSVRGFLPAALPRLMLLVSDEPESEGPASVDMPLSSSVVSGLLPPPGFTVRTERWSSLEPALLDDASVLVLLCGSNANPLDDQAKREAITRFVASGGRLMIEGGDLGRRYSGLGEQEEIFRRQVLGIRGVVEDGPPQGFTLDAACGERFQEPLTVPSSIGFSPGSRAETYDGLLFDQGDRSISEAARWDGPSGSTAILTHADRAGRTTRIIFGFAVGAIPDRGVAQNLVRNALTLLTDSTAVSTDVASTSAATPTVHALAGNYPNPFNGATVIRYDLAGTARVRLSIHDVLGREVAVVEEGMREAGRYDVSWDARTDRGTVLSSGTYYARLIAVSPGGGVLSASTQAMVYIR